MLQRYRPATMFMHWLMAALLVAQVWLGWWMIGLPKTPPGMRAGWFNFHKSVGLALLLLVLVRALMRHRSPPPPLPAELPAWERALAHTGHLAIYLVLAALPLAGVVGSVASGYPIKFFGLALPLPVLNLPDLKQFMSLAHLSLVWVLTVLVALHVAAALRHLMSGDGVFQRILPGSR